MKNFFANFAVDTTINEQNLTKDENNDRFIAKMIYKGYIDDFRK